MALITKSTVIYTLLTLILAIIYPFIEWRTSLSNYKESEIDKDFNRQLNVIMHGVKSLNRTINAIRIDKITTDNEHKIGFNLLNAQYSAILSNYIYLINHDTFKHSHDPSMKEPLTESPHNFPAGFNLFYLQLRTENDVNIKWALIENANTNTIFLVLCGTDFLIDMLIDVSFSPLPLTYNPNDISSSKSWTSMFDRTKSDFLDNFLVHGAIGGNIQWLFSNITSILHSVLTPNTKLIACGHSLGAGYATVLAMRMLTLYNQQLSDLNVEIKLFTFGSPAVLSGESTMNESHPTLETLNRNTFNFVNRFDIIPRLLGEQFDVLYPKFLWNDELLLNQIKSFKPLGNYYILHDKNRILYGLNSENHDILSEQILKIIPRALLGERNDARTKLVLLIFRFLFGKKYEEYINYLLWISFSSHPLINDHSMDRYLSLIGDFSSMVTFRNDNGAVFCLNSALKFVDSDQKTRNKKEMEWRVTQYGQLQNLKTKECIYMDWKLDDVFAWKFKYKLKKTRECATKVTKFTYLNSFKVFKILSDEHIDDYESVDVGDLIQDQQSGTEGILMDEEINNDLNGLCLGCNLTTNKLDVYQCNESYKEIETAFYFNPHNIAENDRDHLKKEQVVPAPQWTLWQIFDEFF